MDAVIRQMISEQLAEPLDLTMRVKEENGTRCFVCTECSRYYTTGWGKGLMPIRLCNCGAPTKEEL